MTDHDSGVIAHVEEDHARIKELMQELTSATAPPETPPDDFRRWRLSLLRQLRDFQHVLLNHFDLEEVGGFTEDLRTRAPRLGARIDQIADDHDAILRRLGAIIDGLKSLDQFREDEVDDLFESIRALVTYLRTHEAMESALLQDAYYRDVGVGD